MLLCAMVKWEKVSLFVMVDRMFVWQHDEGGQSHCHAVPRIITP